MTLQRNGPISIGDIRGEFGGAAPDGIDEYYAGAATGYVKAGEAGINGPIPAGGPVKLSDYYGAPLPKEWDGDVFADNNYRSTGTRYIASNGEVVAATGAVGQRLYDSGGSRIDVLGSYTPAIVYTDPKAMMPVQFHISHITVRGAANWSCNGGAVPVRGLDGNYYCLPKSSYSEMTLPVGFWHDMGTPRGPTVTNPSPAQRQSGPASSEYERIVLDMYVPPGNPALAGVEVHLSNPTGTAILPASQGTLRTVTTPASLRGAITTPTMDVIQFVWQEKDLLFGLGYSQFTKSMNFHMTITAI